jgi:photosystem II stability/assembly factor-like uncharacterized protein
VRNADGATPILPGPPSAETSLAAPATTTYLWIGTVGEGLWRSADGDAWTHDAGVPAEARVFSLIGRGTTIFAGGTGCIYRRDGGTWRTLPLPNPALEIWSLALDPARSTTLYAGGRPLALLRSDDGGENWSAFDIALPPGTEQPHTPRVTAILVEGDTIWCGIEVGGVVRSEDGGQTWTAVNDGLPSWDIHALARSGHALARGGGGALLAATPRGIGRFDGAVWTRAELNAPWRYCRALVALPGHDGEMLCGLGDGPPGTRGAVVVSKDDGHSWHSALFPGLAQSTVWSLAVDPDDPDHVLAGAIGGEIFESEDAGRAWTRLPRAFREVRAVLIH